MASGNKKMKSICFIQDGLGGGGAEHVICNLANQFVNDGYPVEIGLYGYDTIAYELDKRVIISKIDRDHYVYKNTVEKFYYQLRRVFVYRILYPVGTSIAKLISPFWRKPIVVMPGRRKAYYKKLTVTEPISRFIDERPDAVIVSFMVHCYTNVAEAIGENKKNKFIISERDDPNAVTGKEMKRRRSFAMHMADACVFQTEQAYRCLVGEIGEKGIVIPNPISNDLISPYQGERRKTIVNFCRLNNKKNLPLLIRAFKQVNNKHPEYELNIYGKGELKEQLLELIQTLGLENRAFIFDFTPDIHEIIKDCAMFVSSSDYEGISNSMVEAMAIGLPTICTDCPIGGAAAMIRSGENGILTPVGDEKALVEAMNYFIENPIKADELGIESTAIRNKLSCEKIAENWENVINNTSNHEFKNEASFLVESDMKRLSGGVNEDNALLVEYFRRAISERKPKDRRHYQKKYYSLAKEHHIEMPCGCSIGPGFYIGHPYSITINRDTIIGSNVNIYKGATIGQENRGKRKGTPIIGNRVWIGINAVVVGRITIGDDVLVAPNSYVNCDVPSHSIVFGNPCQIKHRDAATDAYIYNIFQA